MDVCETLLLREIDVNAADNVSEYLLTRLLAQSCMTNFVLWKFRSYCSIVNNYN